MDKRQGQRHPDLSNKENSITARVIILLDKIKDKGPEEIRQAIIALMNDNTISASDKKRREIIFKIQRTPRPLDYAYNLIQSGCGDKVI